MSQYAYTRPRRVNVMTVLLVVVVVLGVYLGVKFVPAYWNRYKVDEVLTDIAFQAIDLRLATPDARYDREQALVAKARERIAALGIDAEDLDVYFDPEMSTVHADYTVVVDLVVLDPTVLDFRRAIDIPGDDKVP
jgi:hypothetical protein